LVLNDIKPAMLSPVIRPLIQNQTPALRYPEEPDWIAKEPGSSEYLRAGVGRVI
jgi:hypothetical protein